MVGLLDLKRWIDGLRADEPDRDLIEEVVLALELLHLAVSHWTILGLKEVLLDFMPLSSVLVS